MLIQENNYFGRRMIATNQKKKRKGFSKQLLVADYVIAVILLIAFFICVYINGTYTMETMNKLISANMDVSSVIISPPFDLNIFGILLSTWIVQLGVSSGAYYVLIKSEHKIELPIQLLNDLPNDVKEKIDTTQIITAVLSCTNN